MSDIRLERTLYGSRELVLDAWRSRERLTEWFGPDLGTSIYVEDLDFTSGGRWRVTVGSETVGGTFIEMDPPDRFAFTWQWEHEPETAPSTVVVMLTERSDTTTELLVQHSDLDGSDRAGRAERDWTAMLDRLDQLVREHSG